MNNRFFADRNDFFKYDLLLELMQNARFLKQLTFVPMLTPDDGRKGGGLTRYQCGSRRPELYQFLRDCLAADRRDIRELRRFFANHPFQYAPYRDSEVFQHELRNKYFRGIPSPALEKALVLLDPDNGLEVDSMNSKNGDRYVTYDELHGLLSRADRDSILLTFQYIPRQNLRQYIQQIAARLRHRIRIKRSIFVSDNRILFVIMGKDTHNLVHLRQVLETYAHEHELALMTYGLDQKTSLQTDLSRPA